MDREALRARLEARSKVAVERALDAMEASPMDNIVGGSEMEIREICDGLKREIFQELVQARIEDVEAAAKPSLSPPAGRRRAGATGALEGQGRSGPVSAHRQR
jgi:hypothetical protein